MKHLAIAATAALLCIGQAQAQTPQFQSSALYGELGYTWLKVDAAGTSARPDAIRGILGYDFHPNFALEGMVAGGVNSDNKDGTVNGTPTNVNVKLSSMYGLWIKPKYDWGQLETFGRFGYAHTSAKIKSNNNALVDSTQSDNDFAWGLGLNYRFNRNAYVGADWMRYDNQSGHHIDGLTLSVGYHW